MLDFVLSAQRRPACPSKTVKALHGLHVCTPMLQAVALDELCESSS